MERGLKNDTIRKPLGTLKKPGIYDENYVKLLCGMDALVIKTLGVVLVKGDSMAYVPGAKIVEDVNGHPRVERK